MEKHVASSKTEHYPAGQRRIQYARKCINKIQMFATKENGRYFTKGAYRVQFIFELPKEKHTHAQTQTIVINVGIHVLTLFSAIPNELVRRHVNMKTALEELREVDFNCLQDNISFNWKNSLNFGTFCVLYLRA